MFTDFFEGIRSYGQAFRLIKDMRLWSYAFLPAIISILLALGIGFSVWGLSDDLGNILLFWYPWEWGQYVISNISNWVGGFLIGLMGLIVFKYLVLIFSAPFMSILSEKVESNLTGNHQKTNFSVSGAFKDLVRGARISFRNFIREIALTIIFLTIGLIPIFGIISPVLLFITQAFYAGFGNIDYTLERHFSVKQSVHFIKQYRFLAIGNGTIFLLLLMTGIGFLIAPPLATIAGTIESINRLKADQIVKFKAAEYV